VKLLEISRNSSAL